MPFYEYECSACKFYVEALQKISEPPLRKCPSCKKQSLKRLVSAPVFRLKGAGWYETDFKSDQENKRNLAGREEGGESKPEESKADASKDAASKPEAKPAETKTEAPSPKERRPGKSVAISKPVKSAARVAKPAKPAKAKKPAKPAKKKATRR